MIRYSGDWAGNVWGSAGLPGQEQSCAQMTGAATCSDFVQNNGAAFSEACEWLVRCLFTRYPYLHTHHADWEVKSVKIYQTS